MRFGALFCLLMAVLALSGCGQRVAPAEPAGKLQPSHAY